jgi:hypothetical protein
MQFRGQCGCSQARMLYQRVAQKLSSDGLLGQDYESAQSLLKDTCRQGGRDLKRQEVSSPHIQLQ